MDLKFSSAIPVSLQISRQIKSDILNGRYKPGTQIPTVRQLAFETSVNPNTVQKALSALESEGLLESRGTVGRFVTSDESIIKEALVRVRREFMEDSLKAAAELGITAEMFVEYIKGREM